ncbi:MAG: PKD domain-containing protein [Bacteroidota bacterium]
MVALKSYKIHKNILSILICLFCVFYFNAKSQCFQIENILVAACDGTGQNEGRNEMVTFKLGSTALNANNLNVSWPNSSNLWLGVCQNATTASKIAQINGTIIGCGFLKEPVNGLLPANSRVLLVSSTAFNQTANSFANLTDTLLVIFQCSGNTAGHFANFGTGLRTLSMNFSTPASCNDAVTYNRALLTMQNGIAGDQDGATVQFSPSGAATYVNYGCQAPYTPLMVDAGPNKTICNNSSQNLIATAAGNYSSILWTLGSSATGSLSSTNTLATVYTPGINDIGTIKLYCSLFKACGTQTTSVKDSVNITVLQLPQPVISASSDTVCNGQSTTLTYSLTNSSYTGTTSVVWLPNGFSTPTLSTNFSHNYTVSVANACGASTDTYSITGLSSPTISITSNGPTKMCTAGNVILTANSNSSIFVWSGGATTPTISVNTSTVMTVTATNVCGSAQASQTISFVPATLTLTVNKLDTRCFSSSTGTANVIVTGGAAPYTYNWLPGGQITPSVSNLQGGTYSVTVYDVNNCVQTQTFVIVEPTVISPNLSETQPTCVGNNGAASVSATGGVPPYSYTWAPTGQNTPAISGLGNGTYTINITDANNCFSISQTALLNSNGNSFSVTINSTSVSCFGGNNGSASALVTGGQSPYTYFWSPNGSNLTTINNLAAGSYSIKVVDNANCEIIKNFSINEPSVLKVSSTGTIVCQNQPASVNASASGGTVPYTYNWDNGAFTGANYTISPTANTIYTVTVSDNNGCIANDTALVKLADNLSLDFSSDVQDGCPKLCVNFFDLTPATTLTVKNWQWDFGDGTSGSTKFANHCYATPGNYSVSLTLTTSQGCTQTVIKPNHITVFTPPHADFVPSDFETDVDNSEITFTNLSIASTNWLWNFNDGNLSSAENPNHHFENEGNYNVTLTVSDLNNCRDSITQTIIISDNYTFYAPNAFTPNGDMKNDLFLPLGNGWNLDTFDLKIFNRWGSVIFHTTDTAKGWDGKLTNGEPAKSDVYVWQVELKDNHNKEYYYVGHISLIK